MTDPHTRQELLERFLRYVSFDTQSDPDSTSYPSTEKQLSLLRELRDELSDMGLSEVEMDRYGYVTATIPASPGCENQPVIGLLSHVDTSPDMTGAGVSPQVITDYNGEDIPLNSEVTMRVQDFPELAKLRGHTLITTDGTTLLGADDKAGVAEIMTAAAWLIAHPELPHPKVRICFTPDEEVGRGVDHLDIEKFGARFAYTLDGGGEGELEYENFNAAGAKISIAGRNIHPGYAKDKMINALQLAFEINQMVPSQERPRYTEGYEGFYHLTHLDGGVEQAEMEYIIRDHHREKFERRKEMLSEITAFVARKYPEAVISCTLTDQYYNMHEKIAPHPEVIDKALEAIRLAGLKPRVRPIRGGTDGARLSHMGLPCPNLFTGGMNFHGRFEYCSLDSMERAVNTILHLLHQWSR